MEASDLEKLIAAHDGEVALLYLYRQTVGKSYESEKAALKLCRTLHEIRSAEEKLQRMGLLGESTPEPASTAALTPPEERPEYAPEDLKRLAEDNQIYRAILQEGQRVFGRLLSTPEMQTLYSFYDYLALPPEVIFELLHYASEHLTRGGRISLRMLEEEGYAWARQEITTLERAESYIARQRERLEKQGRIQRAVDIRGRNLTASEKKYIQSWIEMGFDEDAVAIAYDRTMLKKPQQVWAYLNKILLSWHEKGLHTAAEIEQGDTPAKRPAPSSGHRPSTVDELQKMLEMI